MNNLLLTGVGGFVGSHVLQYFLENTDWNIIGIDSFRHKGTYSRINQIFDNINDYSKIKNRFKIYNHDLSVPIDQVLRNKILNVNLNKESLKIDYIINLASDSAVERSIYDPVACLTNNFNIALNMLEFARTLDGLKVFLQFDSDESFGEAFDKPHTEWDSIVPSNPYAASKACQTAMAVSYWRSYKLPVVITNSMNIIGNLQDKEKFLPKLIWKLALGQKMQIYADENNKIGSRFYIHSDNLSNALLFILNKTPKIYPEANKPDRYNIVGDEELDNLQVAKIVSEHLKINLNYELVKSDSIRPGYDKRYALDGTKLDNLGWKPIILTRDAIRKVAEWTYKNPWWVL